MSTARQFARQLVPVALLTVIAAAVPNRAAAQPCAPVPPDLVSWWPGDDDASDIADGNDAITRNGATFADGHVGRAFSFDGVDDWVDVPEANSLKIGDEMTVDAWVRLDRRGRDYQTVFDNLGGPEYTNGILISARPNSQTPDGETLALYVSNRAEHTIANFFAIGSFTHIAVTTQPDVTGVHGVTKVYKNGTLIETFNTSILKATTAATRFGARATSEREPLRGLIDEVEVHRRALDADAIQSIFKAGSAGKCKPGAAVLDHFECYQAAGKAPGVTVTLVDPAATTARTLVGAPELLCNPVDKNGEGIRNSSARLTCYRIGGDGKRGSIVVSNQFGPQPLKTGGPQLLCVPSTVTAVP